MVGGSGSGKSTLIKSLCGARAPEAGSVLLDGHDLYDVHEWLRASIGYVPQHESLHDRLTVRETLAYTARLRLGLTGTDLVERVADAVGRVALAHRVDTPVTRLSGGERRRVAIAIELLAQPRLLLLDEPTSGLDPALDQQFMQLFRALAMDGCTVVVVTHSVLYVDLADRVVFLAPGGRVAYDGPPERVTHAFAATDIAECFSLINADPEGAAERHRARTGPPPTPPEPDDELFELAGHQPDMLLQLRVLIERYLLVLGRDRRYAAFLLLQAPVIGMMLFLVAKSGGWSDGDSSARAAQQLAFATATVVVWFGLINSAREIAKEHAVYDRERLAFLRPSAYLCSKLLPLAALVSLQSLFVLLLVVVRAGIPRDGLLLPGLLELQVTLALTGIAATALGLFVSCASRNEDRATSLVPFLLVPQFVLAGVAFDLSPPWDALERLTLTSWAVSALGSSIDLCNLQFAGALTCSDALRMPILHELGALLTRWAVLALATGTFVLATAATLLLREHRQHRR